MSLPATAGGSTGYYSTTTISGTVSWVSTAIKGCKYSFRSRSYHTCRPYWSKYPWTDTPASDGPPTTYFPPAPTKVVEISPGLQVSTYPAAVSPGATATPIPWLEVASTSSFAPSSAAGPTHNHKSSSTTSAAPSPKADLSEGAIAGTVVGVGSGLALAAAATATNCFASAIERTSKYRTCLHSHIVMVQRS